MKDKNPLGVSKPAQTWNGIWRSHEYSAQDLRIEKARYKLHLFKASLKNSLPRNPKVLDLGCGSGAWAKAIMQEWPAATVLGVDISTEAASKQAALHSHPNVRFMQTDLTEAFQLGEQFDLITCVGLLEHLVRWRPLLDSIQLHLRPGGLLLLIHSNLWSPFRMERTIRRMLRKWPYGHQRELSGRGLGELLTKHRLNTVERYSFPCNEGRLVSRFDRAWHRVTSEGRYIAILASKSF